MKKIILLLGLFQFEQGYSQIGVTDIGLKSWYQVKNYQSTSPCEVTAQQVLTYCVEDGSKISYLFKNNILDGIATMTAFSTRYAADRALEYAIASQKAALGFEPFISGGQTIFLKKESPIYCSYSVEYINRTYYMVFYVAKN